MAQKDWSLEAGLHLCEKLTTLQSFVMGIGKPLPYAFYGSGQA